MKTKSYKTCALLLLGIIYAFAIFCVVLPKKEISESERRKLAEFPQFTAESFLRGKFASDFEEYATDNFPFRDTFRAVKSAVSYNVFAKSDNNDIYIYGGSMMKLEKKLDEASVNNALKKFGSIYERYLKGKNCNVYASVVPDKAYFVWKDRKNVPLLDYEKLFEAVKEGMPYAKYIDLTDTLELSDFYNTDSHWRQEKITDTADKLLLEMGNTVPDRADTITLAKEDFRGVYSGQSASFGAEEKLYYLTNDTLSSCITKNYETGKTSVGVYDAEKLDGRDPYEVFLSGACAAISVENPNAPEKRELVIFRDSYGSSIAPLLADSYSKITLIDIRYMNPEYIGNFAQFENADVLFLYSSTLINSSSALR